MKMRNLLEEFRNVRGNHGIRNPTILGVREHVFTGRLLFEQFHLCTAIGLIIRFCIDLLYIVSAVVCLHWHHLCQIRKPVLLLWANVFLLTSSK
jgi:hypothetical protein